VSNLAHGAAQPATLDFLYGFKRFWASLTSNPDGALAEDQRQELLVRLVSYKALSRDWQVRILESGLRITAPVPVGVERNFEKGYISLISRQHEPDLGEGEFRDAITSLKHRLM
jgi:hypothetical protein